MALLLPIVDAISHLRQSEINIRRVAGASAGAIAAALIAADADIGLFRQHCRNLSAEDMLAPSEGE
ncbi:MAG: patatin-like phospholipase family protein [Devosia sp.]|nr:patatin-like phospholipase family protein [Devosia sp.]